jgi:hypothetical protein
LYLRQRKPRRPYRRQMKAYQRSLPLTSRNRNFPRLRLRPQLRDSGAERERGKYIRQSRIRAGRGCLRIMAAKKKAKKKAAKKKKK